MSQAIPLRRKVPEWLATSILVGGAYVVSVYPTSAIDWHVFAAFLIGHTILVADFAYARHMSMIALNLGLLLLDVYAIWIRL